MVLLCKGTSNSKGDEVRNNWNTHYIRKSRFETVSGRPDSLFTIPEFHGGVDGLIVPVHSAALDYGA